MRKTIVLLYNPVAGKGRFIKRLDTVIDIFQSSGLQVLPRRISSNEEMFGLVENICREECHTLAVAGGDGTVHGAVNALMKSSLNIPLGIFPEGTSNDVANFLKIPDEPAGYCRLVVENEARPVDVGQVNENYFINVASAGFVTETAHQVGHNFKNALGRMAYYLKAVNNLPRINSLKVQVKVDEKTVDIEALMFLVLNSGTVAGFPEVLPQGSMNDGILDFLAVKPASVPRLMELWMNYRRGRLMQDENVFHCQGRCFHITVEPSTVTDLDGEIGPSLPWDVRLHPGALRIRT